MPPPPVNRTTPKPPALPRTSPPVAKTPAPAPKASPAVQGPTPAPARPAQSDSFGGPRPQYGALGPGIPSPRIPLRPAGTGTTQADKPQSQKAAPQGQTQGASAKKEDGDDNGPLAKLKKGGEVTKTVTDLVLGTQTRTDKGPVRRGLPDGTVASKNTIVSRGANRLGVLGTVAQLPQGGKEVIDAVKKGDTREIADKAAGLTSGTLNAAKGGLETVAQGSEFRALRNAARDKLRSTARGDGVQVGRWEARRIAGKAARANLAPLNQGRRTLTLSAAEEAAKKLNVRPELKDATKRAFEGASTAARRSLPTTAAKAAGRLVPGLNWGIAAADGAAMVATLKNPKADPVKKGAAVITALGSFAAATNIPVVSQIGAGVSAVSSLVGSFFGKD